MSAHTKIESSAKGQEDATMKDEKNEPMTVGFPTVGGLAMRASGLNDLDGWAAKVVAARRRGAVAPSSPVVPPHAPTAATATVRGRRALPRPTPTPPALLSRQATPQRPAAPRPAPPPLARSAAELEAKIARLEGMVGDAPKATKAVPPKGLTGDDLREFRREAGIVDRKPKGAYVDADGVFRLGSMTPSEARRGEQARFEAEDDANRARLRRGAEYIPPGSPPPLPSSLTHEERAAFQAARGYVDQGPAPRGAYVDDDGALIIDHMTPTEARRRERVRREAEAESLRAAHGRGAA